jgi:hypothetical protein
MAPVIAEPSCIALHNNPKSITMMSPHSTGLSSELEDKAAPRHELMPQVAGDLLPRSMALQHWRTGRLSAPTTTDARRSDF